MVMSNWPQLENLYLCTTFLYLPATNIIRDAGVLNLLASNYSLRRIFLKIKRSDNEPKSTIIRRKLTKLMPNRFARMKEWDVSLWFVYLAFLILRFIPMFLQFIWEVPTSIGHLFIWDSIRESDQYNNKVELLGKPRLSISCSMKAKLTGQPIIIAKKHRKDQ